MPKKFGYSSAFKTGKRLEALIKDHIDINHKLTAGSSILRLFGLSLHNEIK